MGCQVNVTISYGDRHYRVRIDHVNEYVDGQERMEYAVVAAVYKGLMDFHGNHHTTSMEVANLKRKLHEMAHERPDLIQYMRDKGIV